jgi:hypothetical protein
MIDEISISISLSLERFTGPWLESSDSKAAWFSPCLATETETSNLVVVVLRAIATTVAFVKPVILEGTPNAKFVSPFEVTVQRSIELLLLAGVTHNSCVEFELELLADNVLKASSDFEFRVMLERSIQALCDSAHIGIEVVFVEYKSAANSLRFSNCS